MQKFICWCGQIELENFSETYLLCPICRTLVSKEIGQTNKPSIQGEKKDLYSSHYWFEHQTNELGLPDLTARARSDLPERCVYWLRAILKYRLPPAAVLELGSSHGGFVAMLRMAGYEAAGLELSPKIVEYAKATFNIPVLQGSLEDQNPEKASQDVLVLMDVLEHLPKPKKTLALCLKSLKPGGFLVIQTPMFPADLGSLDLIKKKHPFGKMLLPKEHLYLFSKGAVERMLTEIGAKHILFEKPFFSQYDMFVFASFEPMQTNQVQKIEKYLLSSPERRFLLALMDKEEAYRKLEIQLIEAEQDRARRLKSITKLQKDLVHCEADRTARLESINHLEQLLRESEADRVARLDAIEKLEKLLQDSEVDRAARIESIHQLENQLRKSDKDRHDRLVSIHKLEAYLKESETDRAARLDALQLLEKRLQESEADRAARLDIIHALEVQLQESESDRAARLDTIQILTQQITQFQEQPGQVTSSNQSKIKKDKTVQDERSR